MHYIHRQILSNTNHTNYFIFVWLRTQFKCFHLGNFHFLRSLFMKFWPFSERERERERELDIPQRISFITIDFLSCTLCVSFIFIILPSSPIDFKCILNVNQKNVVKHLHELYYFVCVCVCNIMT